MSAERTHRLLDALEVANSAGGYGIADPALDRLVLTVLRLALAEPDLTITEVVDRWLADEDQATG